VSRLLVRYGVFDRGPFRGGLGDADGDAAAVLAPPATDSEILVAVDLRTKAIYKQLEADARDRKFALMIAGASALFAAVKLGIIAFPALRARVKSTP
jgi:hypothetical protein